MSSSVIEQARAVVDGTEWFDHAKQDGALIAQIHRAVEEFSKWAGEELPESHKRRSTIGRIDLGSYTADSETEVRVRYGLTHYRQRSKDEPGQPYSYHSANERVLSIVQERVSGGNVEQIGAQVLAYKRDLQELPRPLLKGLVEHLSAIRSGETTPSGQLVVKR